MWKHGREVFMIFCAWGYRNESISRPQSQCDAEILSVFIVQAVVHKQTNAVQCLSASSHLISSLNFLVSESFPWLSGVLKWLVESFPMMLPIFLAFNTGLHKVIQFCMFENLLSSTAMPVLDVKITVLETLKPLTTRSVTNSGLAIII